MIKSISLLDNILYGFPTSFNVFVNANGLDVVVSRISKECKECLQLLATGNEKENVENESILPYEKSCLMRNLLKFIMHLMQTSGNADRMRNLIDTSLPESLHDIFKNPKGFGASVYGIGKLLNFFYFNESF